jgi:uncharacterized membrane protein YphA (DoxX/SURF4 family)
MPPRRLIRAFLVLWLVTGSILLLGGVETARDAWAGTSGAHPHIAVIGAVEALAAILFLIPRTMRLGALALLATIGAALLIHSSQGQFRGDLLVYGAAVAFVAIHGSLPSDQRRFAIRKAATL